MLNKSIIINTAIGTIVGGFILAVGVQLFPQVAPTSVASHLPTLTK